MFRLSGSNAATEWHRCKQHKRVRPYACMRLLCRDVAKYVALSLSHGGQEGVEGPGIVTASGKGQLKQLPMAKLKQYAKAYNIDVSGLLEKDEFIDRLIATRVSHAFVLTVRVSFRSPVLHTTSVYGAHIPIVAAMLQYYPMRRC